MTKDYFATFLSSPRALAACLLALPLQAAAVDMLVSNLTDAPDPAVRGGTIVYAASITNNTSDVAHNVSLVFPLDAQTSFVSVNDAACSYAAGTHTVTCSYPTVQGDVSGPGTADVHDVSVTVRSLAGAGSTVSLTATVSSTDADTNAGNDSLSQVTTVDNGADLGLALSASPVSVPASGTLTYTAAVSNGGPNVAGTVTASITLSPNVTYQSASGGGWTCGAAGQLVTCSRTSAALGAQPDISIVTRVTGAVTGTVTSTGVVALGGGATDYDNSNDASSANATITSGTDLEITKTASAALLASGQAMSFTLAPRNLGPFSATSVTVSDSLPAGFSGISAAGTGWTCSVSGQDVSCTRASYAVGAANNITINATAPVVVALTAATNTASIASATPDGNAGNDSGSVGVSIVPDGVDLELTKTKSPNPVAQGSNMVSTVRVTNHGPRAAASGEVRVIDTLPAGESYSGTFSGSNWTCAAQVGQDVTCTYNAALAVGASASDLLLTTTATAAGTLGNTACASYTDSGASLSDPIGGNNCASASALSTAAPASLDLQLAKSADTGLLAWNAPTITYTLTVTNAGPGAATGVVLTDPIPGYIAGKTVVAAALSGGTSTATFACSGGSTVSCSQNGGSMASGSTAVFTVTVTRPVLDSAAQPGNVWTNSASVTSTDQGDTNPANNSASANVQVDPVADLTVVDTVTPGSAAAGTNATYVLTVNNNGPSSAAGVTLSDVFTIPSGSMTFISATPSAGSCAAYDGGTHTLSCSLGSIGAGGTATVTVVVRPDYMIAPPSPREITNTVSVATTTQESNAGNNSAAVVLAVTAASLDLLVNNTDNVDPLGFVPASGNPAFPDNVVTYRNTITNRGPSVASGLVLSYTMRPPAGKSITFVGDKLAATGQAYAGYCDQAGVQVTGPATQTITCTFPPAQILAAGNASTDLYLDYHVDTQPGTSGDSYSSTVAITSNEPDTVAANNSTSQTTTVKMRADLQLAKAARASVGGVDSSVATVELRQPFYYVLTLTNAGPGDSQVTNLTDSLPAGLALYAGGSVAPYNAAPYNAGVLWSTNNATPTNGSCSGAATISCAIGLLESGKVATVKVPVVSTSYAASVQNCASATTGEVDPNPANNTGICATVAMQRASLAGTVYADSNNDAAKAVGESGIAGVSLRLDGTDIYGNTVTNLSATTDASGNYSFSDRAPGTYTITETQASGYLDGKEAAGTAGGTASGVGADTISAITLPANTAATGYLFGELAPASLSGFVFVDLNADARRDLTGVGATDESAGITSVTVSLTGTDDLGAVSTSTTTGASGAYSFANLRPGTYQVVEATLGGVTHTGMTVGSKGGNDGATAKAANTPVPGAAKRTVSNVALAAGDAGADYNFGESGQGLGGSVYADLNNNGVKDAGEPGIAGVAVTLSGNTSTGTSVCLAISPNPCTLATDASGVFSFLGLPASDGAGYTLTEQSQAAAPLSAYADGTDSRGSVNGVAVGSVGNDVLGAIVIATGQIGSNYHFGEIAASLSGKVYLDVDQGGTFNAGDTPLAGVTLTLSGLSASGAGVCTIIGSCTTTSDASGDFAFTGLPASNGAGYTVTETQPLDYVDAVNSAGTGASAAGTPGVAAGNSRVAGIVLGAGQSGVNYRFGEKTGSLSGFVYHDANNNGVKDGAEAPLAGVTLTLAGTAASGAGPCASAPCTATTLADGSYTFSGLRNAGAGGYSVTETQPAAWLDGIVRKGTLDAVACAACSDAVFNVIGAIPFNAANSWANFNFGEVQPAGIAGMVYIDADQDAVPGAGEALQGVTLTLGGTDDRGNAVNASVQTGADGRYSFTGLRPSNGAGYTVSETQPAGLSQFAAATGTQPGTIGAVATGTAAVDSVSAIVLASGAAAVDYNFREIGASIAGTVYYDANNNHLRDAGESGIGGVAVTLSGAAARSTLTDASGNYQFSALLAGTYTVRESQPADFADGSDTAGTSGGTLNTPKNSIASIALGSGVAATGYLFGETELPAVNGSLAGQVYLDANANASRDAGDTALAGVKLQLAGTTTLGTQISFSATTGADGGYLFPVVPPGTYTLTETQPAYEDFAAATGTALGTLAGGSAALNSVTGLVMPMAGGAATGYDFREGKAIASASLAGVVYHDGNDNGVQDAGEPGIAGVTVIATGPAGEAGRAVTGADGSFKIASLPAGTYSLVETQPDGYLDGRETAGSLGGASDNGGFDAGAAHNSVAGIVLGTGQDGSAYLFGERRGGLHGYVYMDDNDNGAKDAGEQGLAGVHVTLSGTPADGTSLCAQRDCVAVTAADGSYRFDNLAPGRYTLVENQLDLDTVRIADGKDSAGQAGGKVDNSGFGTAPGYNTIGQIEVTAAAYAAHGGALGGYLFGERSRTLGLKPPIVSGYVWMDRAHTRVRPQDGTLEGVRDWTVTLSQDGKTICTVQSDARGFYQFDNLHCPGYEASGLPSGSGYEIRFTKDGNRLPNVASSGGGAGVASGGAIRNLTLHDGDDLTEQNLPLDPSGVVYDSVSRLPLAGAVVTFSGPAGFDPARHLLGGLDALNQTTGSDGLYQFFLQNDFPSGAYHLTVSRYPAGYTAAPSERIPACVGIPTVGPVPDPALVQKSNTAPAAGTTPHQPDACAGMVPGGAPTTQYYFGFTITPQSAPILNNHIPLDPLVPAGLSLVKTGDKQQLEFGESLLYTVTVKQTGGSPVSQATVRDLPPAGFALVPGTVRVNGKPVADPLPASGVALAFNVGPLAAGKQAVLSYRMRAGVGSLQGDGVNRATAYACNTVSGCLSGNAPLAGAASSNTGSFKVRLNAGVFTDQACVAGKVFVDCNNNHVQDGEELGVPGVRLYLEDGTSFTTDVEGKFSYCGLSPKSHVLKADSLSLPRGSALTTTSSRNLGDAGSLWLDVKNGELLRADFAEGSCSAPVIEQVKARRSQGGVRSVETEAARLPGLKFDSKDPGAPRQATDKASQPVVKPRQGTVPAVAGESRAQ